VVLVQRGGTCFKRNRSTKRVSHGFPVYLDTDMCTIDREILHTHMEEYGLVKELSLEGGRAVVTFFEQEAARRAWKMMHGAVSFGDDVRLDTLTADRGRSMDKSSCRSRERSAIGGEQHVFASKLARRSSSLSPPPRQDKRDFDPNLPLSMLRQRSRSCGHNLMMIE